MSRRKPLRAGSYDTRRAQLMGSITPWTRCWRCGLTLAEHAPHKNGKPARWEAGHVYGNPSSPLALEASTCNRIEGGRVGGYRSQRRQEPRSPNA